jgi:SAM-dependent methyltransferase
MDSSRRQARATWSAGDWENCSGLVAPVGAVVIERIGVGPGLRLLDVGTGSGGNLAIPAALLGAEVVGLDVTPELLALAREHADEAGVAVEWVEGDAMELPFRDGSFDRVTSTFGAMFAPDHARTARELVRVCRPTGRIAMATWLDDGFIGELFTLTGRFLPPPPPGVQPPSRWGDEAHVRDVFGTLEVSPSITREIVEFDFASVDAAVQRYAASFGPFVSARAVLEPQGRWPDFLSAFRELVERFNRATDGTARIPSGYLLIQIER